MPSSASEPASASKDMDAENVASSLGVSASSCAADMASTGPGPSPALTAAVTSASVLRLLSTTTMYGDAAASDASFATTCSHDT
jgi:hypothetical protein